MYTQRTPAHSMWFPTGINIWL